MNDDAPATPRLSWIDVPFSENSLDQTLLQDTLRRRVEKTGETIAELRAVLAPLLWEPNRTIYASDGPERECVFCASRETAHAPDCPVLRRDELLGRS